MGDSHWVGTARWEGDFLLFSLDFDGRDSQGRLFSLQTLPLLCGLLEKANMTQPGQERWGGLTCWETACTCSSGVSVDFRRGSSGAGPGSAGRAAAGGSWWDGVGEHSWAWGPPGLYRKDLTGVRSRYTRSGSGSLEASVAGAASSGSTCRERESGGFHHCLYPLGCGGGPLPMLECAGTLPWGSLLLSWS